MLIVPPPKKRKGKLIEPEPGVPVPPVALVLVSAVYSINDSLVTLTFNRQINIEDVDTHAFKIDDGLYANQKLDGATYGPDGGYGITVYLDQVESYSSSTCLMNVSAGNGIKDAITGTAWGGVTGYPVTIG